MSSVSERFLRYVSFDTQSDETSETCPSTAKQKVLGEHLVAEMKAIGIADGCFLCIYQLICQRLL